MSVQVVVTNKARLELAEMTAYIASDSPLAARRFVRHFLQLVDDLAVFPDSSAVLDLPGVEGMNLRKAKLRGFPNHFVIYDFDGRTIRILRAFHAAQDWQIYLADPPDAARES